MKSHRQNRTSKRVSSETGTATITTDNAEPSKFEVCINEMERLLKPFAPNERIFIVADIAKRMMMKGKNG